MKKVRILCDKSLLIFGLTTIAIGELACFWGAFMILREDLGETHSDSITCAILFAVSGVVMLLAGIAALPRWLCTITLCDDYVSVWVPFHKAEKIPYKQYINIYHGRYFHGNPFGVGMWISYIVFSQKYLPPQKLNSVNQLPQSPELFKIRYRPKICESLLSVLPKRQKDMMNKVICEIKRQ